MSDQFRLADALDRIAEGYAAAAMVLRIGPENSPEPVGAPSFDDLPFDESDATYEDSEPFEDTPAGRSRGGGCPVHGRPWSVQPGGFSASKQKSYKAFWKCPATLPNGNFCPERPTLAWVKAHPAR